MKRSLTFFLSVLCSTVLFSSCKECDTVVTPLEETDVDWLVYNETDSIRFLNEDNEVITFKKVAAAAENVLGQGSQASDDCIGSMDTQAYIMFSAGSSDHPILGTYILRRPNNFQVKILASPNEQGFVLDETTPVYPTIEVGNQLYEQVYEVKEDSTQELSIKQILFNKEEGFLRVEYYDGTLYEKI